VACAKRRLGLPRGQRLPVPTAHGLCEASGPKPGAAWRVLRLRGAAEVWELCIQRRRVLALRPLPQRKPADG